MSYQHFVFCDLCGKKAVAKYNGEHYIAPKDWVELFDPENVTTTDMHLCPKCKPKIVNVEIKTKEQK